MKKLKALKKSDHVALVFGERFELGNTRYDVEVTINGTTHCIPYRYGYWAGSKQSIDEALASIGYCVRKSHDPRAPYREILTTKKAKRESELFKQTANFNYIQDPGHGWLEVPRKLLRELGIEHDVSSCSYIDKGIAYLEEDCDMSLFLAKFKEQLSDVEL
ncbi:MAG: hypothetical protein GY817_02625, partial [bacterium]|nr:hypothetical protein [bacterium]